MKPLTLPADGQVKMKEIDTAVTPLDELRDFEVNTWLTGVKNYRWLLAHTYDGIVWGRYDGNQGWQLSSGLVKNSPQLVTDELMELRVFNDDGESYIWRVWAGFNGRIITDNQPNSQPLHYYDEPQILWGTQIKALPNGFTRLQDGTQGLTHAIPVDSGLPEKKKKNLNTQRPASLTVRHYVEKDKNTGLARVINSRLVTVSLNKELLTEEKQHG